METDKKRWVSADFNGMFSRVLCLSHEDFCVDFEGNRVELSSGIALTAFDEDLYETNQRDDLFASGIVESSPEWLSCLSSR